MIALAICGGPRTGKTTLAAASGYATVRGTDELRHLEWSEASLAASHWFDEPDGSETCVEGVAVVRALRKWLARHAGDELRPCARLIYLCEPRVPLGRGQETMAKGCWTVWCGIRDELTRRGVEIELRGAQP